jgi:quercetin dioxygenase-like cupin family protein
MNARITLGLWVLLALAIAATQGGGQSRGQTNTAAATASPAAATGVTRSVLIDATPANEPDQSLQLVRYDILPGTTLPKHIHPGTQIAYIQSGELTYTVVTGRAEIHRAAGNGTPAATEWLDAGNTTVLEPGDAVIETREMVHYGADLGTEPVVILAADLLDAGQPTSIVQATPVS